MAKPQEPGRRTTPAHPWPFLSTRRFDEQPVMTPDNNPLGLTDREIRDLKRGPVRGAPTFLEKRTD